MRVHAAHSRRRWVLVRHEGRERGRAPVDGDAAPTRPFRKPARRGGGHRGGEEEGHDARRAVEARREAANAGLGSAPVGRSHTTKQTKTGQRFSMVARRTHPKPAC